jgi:uncharacterized protein (DUF1778 family)
MVRLDGQSKAYLSEAARLRQISVSDYVRLVTVSQARREVESSKEQVITLSPMEQAAFWSALSRSSKLTPSQKRLGALMRGES